MDAAVAIVVAAAIACAGPLLLDWRTGRRRALERAEDFARQDAVARKVDQVAADAKVATVETASQLRQIHTLVNSDMTAARQGELDQTRVSLILLRKVVAMAETAGRVATADELAAIEETEKRVTELESILADRLAQMKIVEAEMAAHPL